MEKVRGGLGYGGGRGLPRITSCVIEYAFAYPTGDIRNGVPELLDNSLPLECFNRVTLRRGGHDDKRNNSHGRTRLLEAVV